MEIGLSLGSNLGDRLRNLSVSCEKLEAIPGISILGRSAVYETEPVDVKPEFKDQAFLNAVIVIESALGLRAHAEITSHCERRCIAAGGVAKMRNISNIPSFSRLASHAPRRSQCEVISARTLRDLSHHIHMIEEGMGRTRAEDKNAPREIDIDIIYAANLESEDADLMVPHPRWAERRFVVQPLADVRPDRILPGTRVSVQNVLDSLPEKPKVVLFQEQW